MKKIISFDKNLDFKSMIGDISSIALDHTLKFIDGSNISGDFLITGSYKLTEASRVEESFSFKVPVEIILNEVLDLESAKIDIEDFSYHVEDDDTLVCHIEVKVEGVEVVLVSETSTEEEILNENNPALEEPVLLEEELPDFDGSKKVEIEKEEVLNRDCDSEIKKDVHNSALDIKEIEDDSIDIVENESVDDNNYQEDITISDEKLDISSDVGSLFSSFRDTDETFSTYSIYILRSEETIESIMTKYKVTKEDLESYNDLSNLSIGSKIIIPTTNERD